MFLMMPWIIRNCQNNLRPASSTSWEKTYFSPFTHRQGKPSWAESRISVRQQRLPSLYRTLQALENCSLQFLGAQLALQTSHSLSIQFKNLLHALCPSSESKSYFSSGLCFKWSHNITVFSSSKKSEDHLNSSISVRGLGGAVDALMGINLGNSNSSSLMNWLCFPPPFKRLFSLSKVKRGQGLTRRSLLLLRSRRSTCSCTAGGGCYCIAAS